MHSMTLSVANDDVWQQLLLFLKQLPASDITVQADGVGHNQSVNWDSMRNALPELAELDLVREQPSIQDRNLF